MTTLPTFPAFFHAVWGYDPFPWQTMLAERLTNGEGRWPQVLDLPTAAGKTACMDIAVYALACQAGLPVDRRSAPRRIWFVVDRRIVVDAAYSRAETIATKLREAVDGPLKEVADRLKQVSGTDRPLAFARLRGGILHDDGWARLPSQPAIITSTVDQLGSRLLFRGYGRSDQTASIFAGLACHDSLILLDEAHCSVPFLQTLRNVEFYRGEKWAEFPIRTPFAFAALSATAGEEDSGIERFPGKERKKALAHPHLQRRLHAKKAVELVCPLKASRKTSKGSAEDPLIEEAVERVQVFQKAGKRRIAVIVNRVHTAEEVAAELRKEVKEEVEVVLLTGRLRPYERDRLVEKWERYLKAFEPENPEKPICLVSTQCIEVGADFSFDALITECASLDALRQRFGRLDRMGSLEESEAAILIREEDLKKGEDAIYGEALVNTWNFLNEKAALVGEGKKQKKVIDFGFEALNANLSDVEDMDRYLAPKPDAPILFPAYLDLLCQTSPTPHPEPDVPLFLHGKDRGAPEARVVWRADLTWETMDKWVEVISLCPPNSGEMLSVPLFHLRRWLSDRNAAGEDADVEGMETGGEEKTQRGEPYLLWRGRKPGQSRVCGDPMEIRPNDVVVVPADYGIGGLGQAPTVLGMGKQGLDLWELSLQTAGKPPALRINRTVLGQWTEINPRLKELLDFVQPGHGNDANLEWESEDIRAGVAAVVEYMPEAEGAARLPEWLTDLFNSLKGGRFEEHPAGGILARFRKPQKTDDEPDLFADEDDLTSTLTSAGKSEVSLEDHSESVRWAVEKFAGRCLPGEFLEGMKIAACWHDAGKLDERFQVLLRNGNEYAAGGPLAKSADIPLSPSRRRFIYESSGLPENFRHEMLSVQLAERFCQMERTPEIRDLVLHLIASHHGYARPFVPVCIDAEAPAVTGQFGGASVELTGSERSRLVLHRIDSGITERFWRLTRRYGWWGLAYLEAVLRLADWYGSVHILKTGQENSK